jgi:hypothetical protein
LIGLLMAGGLVLAGCGGSCPRVDNGFGRCYITWVRVEGERIPGTAMWTYSDQQRRESCDLDKCATYKASVKENENVKCDCL